MKFIIGAVIIILYVYYGIKKGTQDDPCWRCKKDKCTGCEHWKEMTGYGKQ